MNYINIIRDLTGTVTAAAGAVTHVLFALIPNNAANILGIVPRPHEQQLELPASESIVSTVDNNGLNRLTHNQLGNIINNELAASAQQEKKNIENELANGSNMNIINADPHQALCTEILNNIFKHMSDDNKPNTKGVSIASILKKLNTKRVSIASILKTFTFEQLVAIRNIKIDGDEIKTIIQRIILIKAFFTLKCCLIIISIIYHKLLKQQTIVHNYIISQKKIGIEAKKLYNNAPKEQKKAFKILSFIKRLFMQTYPKYKQYIDRIEKFKLEGGVSNNTLQRPYNTSRINIITGIEAHPADMFGGGKSHKCRNFKSPKNVTKCKKCKTHLNKRK